MKSHKSFHKGFCFLKNLYLFFKLRGVKDANIPTFSNMYYSQQHIKEFLLKREDLLLTFVAEGIVLEE